DDDLVADRELVAGTQLRVVEPFRQHVLAERAGRLRAHAVLLQRTVVLDREEAHRAVRPAVITVDVPVALEPEIADIRRGNRPLRDPARAETNGENGHLDSALGHGLGVSSLS